MASNTLANWDRPRRRQRNQKMIRSWSCISVLDEALSYVEL